MAKTNFKLKTDNVTHEGAPARRIDAEMQLRRSIMACLLWESEFYEDGESIAARIASLVPQVEPAVVSMFAEEARTKMKLRHVPLFLTREMARYPLHRPFVARTLKAVIQRADELSEFLALYWKEKKIPLAAQVKRGLASAFTKFNEYELAKYNRDNAVKLRDVLFLCHAKPKDKEQAALWKKLVDNKLETPDTWEVRISAAKEKTERLSIWLDLMARNRLGALALLRNLRNMRGDDVPVEKVKEAIVKMKVERVLPFRFIAAARHAPEVEPELEQAMFRGLEGAEPLTGKTLLVVDNSGSMDMKLSARSDLTRRDAAGALAILIREICPEGAIFAFSGGVRQVPARRGMALAEAIDNATEHGGTNTETALAAARAAKPERIIVITDEQSHQAVGGPGDGVKGYFVNVASAKNGIGYGPWTHIDGFSEQIVTYIRESERATQ